MKKWRAESEEWEVNFQEFLVHKGLCLAWVSYDQTSQLSNLQTCKLSNFPRKASHVPLD